MGIIILISLTTVFIGNYFVTYAIARNGDGGDREIRGAGHTESKYKDPETYYTTIFNFIENI